MALKRKHTVSRILAAAVAVAMLGCWPVTAFAEENAPAAEAPDSITVVDGASSLLRCPPTDPPADPTRSTTVELKKSVELRSDTFVPNATFEFELLPGDAIDATREDPGVLAGKQDGLKLDGDGILQFSSEDSLRYPSTTLTKTFTMTVDPSVFDKVGIYHYILREKQGDYDGMTYDTADRDVYVYITDDENNDPVYSGTVVTKKVIENGKEKNVKTFDFLNDYTDTHNLTVTKKLAGNQADKSDEFTFTVSVDGARGEKYLVRKTSTLTTQTFSEILTSSEGSLDFLLKGGESLTIYGLSDRDTYTVTEKEGNTNGYVTTFDGEQTNRITGSIEDDTTVTCINKRDVTIPTGLAVDMLPYAGMVLLAVGCGVYLLRRKHEDEQ